MSYREYAAIPTGEYPARITGAELAEGKFGPQIRWTADLGEVEDTEGNVEPRQLSIYTPTEITPKNKLGRMVVAAGLELGNDLDESDLVGRRLILSVTRKAGDDGQSYYNRVEEFARIKAKAAKPKPAADTDDADDL